MLVLVGCVRPLPLPPQVDVDYCAKPPPMRVEEWRALCGQYPRELARDGGP